MADLYFKAVLTKSLNTTRGGKKISLKKKNPAGVISFGTSSSFSADLTGAVYVSKQAHLQG